MGCNCPLCRQMREEATARRKELKDGKAMTWRDYAISPPIGYGVLDQDMWAKANRFLKQAGVICYDEYTMSTNINKETEDLTTEKSDQKKAVENGNEVRTGIETAQKLLNAVESLKDARITDVQTAYDYSYGAGANYITIRFTKPAKKDAVKETTEKYSTPNADVEVTTKTVNKNVSGKQDDTFDGELVSAMASAATAVRSALDAAAKSVLKSVADAAGRLSTKASTITA